MSKKQPEDDRVAAVRAAWEEGFFHIVHALNEFLDDNDVPQYVESPSTGGRKNTKKAKKRRRLGTRLKTFKRYKVRRTLPKHDPSVDRPFREIRQRFLNVLYGIRQFDPALKGDTEIAPWTIGYVNGRKNEPVSIYGRNDELQKYFELILRARPESCWRKDVVSEILKHQAKWDSRFAGLSDLLSSSQQPDEANPNDVRDKWIYEQCCELVAYKTIIIRLEKKPESWEPITSIPGIKDAAMRYAKRHGLDPIPKRQHGRRKKTKRPRA